MSWFRSRPKPASPRKPLPDRIGTSEASPDSHARAEDADDESDDNDAEQEEESFDMKSRKPEDDAPKVRAPSAERPTVNPMVKDTASTIAADTVVKGTVTTASPIMVAGVIEGGIESGADVFVLADAHVQGGVVGLQVDIRQDARVDGDIRGRDVEIAGRVAGEVHATGRLLIRGSGSVEGDVTVKSLVVEDGGTLRGGCRMGTAP